MSEAKPKPVTKMLKNIQDMQKAYAIVLATSRLYRHRNYELSIALFSNVRVTSSEQTDGHSAMRNGPTDGGG